MLPKLSMLHDEGQVLFFMATNHQRNFDEAIKSPGRFDVISGKSNTAI
jgi:SpoVK/Ycf46/Vps4 family AAA+-type ATPase